VQQRAGFDTKEKPKSTAEEASSPIAREELEKDHGSSWQMVDKILKGDRAESPEAMMRARFTALRFKDPQFLAATERDENLPTVRERNANWQVTLGLKDRDFFEGLMNSFSDIDSLQDPVAFEVVASDEDDVEFKIKCGNGKTLHEKSRFKKDKKWGFVYSGTSEFAKWE